MARLSTRVQLSKVLHISYSSFTKAADVREKTWSLREVTLSKSFASTVQNARSAQRKQAFSRKAQKGPSLGRKLRKRKVSTGRQVTWGQLSFVSHTVKGSQNSQTHKTWRNVLQANHRKSTIVVSLRHAAVPGTNCGDASRKQLPL